MKTWTVKIAGREVQIKALKADAERLLAKLRDMEALPHTWKEIRGVIGGESRETILISLFTAGEGQILDPEGYAADKAALYASIPDVVTQADIPGLIAEARKVFTKHLPIVDLRETPLQVAFREQACKEIEDERKAKTYAWIDEHCASREAILIPEGYMAITLEYNYDDSDLMTDYFNSHHGWGERMLLAIVPKQNQTERLMRSVVDRYPELAALEWTWHKENYSMGHGNWLQSGVVGTAGEDVHVYRGGSDPSVWYEVEATSYSGKVLPYKGYPGQTAQPAPAPSPAGPEDYAVSYDRDWTWVKFPQKPSEAVRAALQAMGARFSHKRVAWYFNRHVDESEIAAAIGGGVPPVPMTAGEYSYSQSCTNGSVYQD